LPCFTSISAMSIKSAGLLRSRRPEEGCMSRDLHEVPVPTQEVVRESLILAVVLFLGSSAWGAEPPPAPVADPPLAAAASPPESACGPDAAFDWTKVPPVRPVPRLGMFLIFPSDSGYYSFLDQVHGNYKEKAPNLPWGTYAFTPGSTFDLDFRYLDKPDN